MCFIRAPTSWPASPRPSHVDETSTPPVIEVVLVVRVVVRVLVRVLVLVLVVLVVVSRSFFGMCRVTSKSVSLGSVRAACSSRRTRAGYGTPRYGTPHIVTL